jgi:CRISPR-associated protein Cmr3
MLPLWLPERVNIEGLSGFVTLAGMRTFLQGAVPEPQQIYAPGQLYGAEQRTGIGINPEQQSVEEGLIYTVNLLRLQPGIGFYAECEIPEALLGLVPDQPWTLPFGGEGRRAMVTRIAPIPWPKAPPVKPQQLRTVVLTTPAWVDSPDALKAWQPKAAALAPWQGISGWDLAQGGPKPLRWTLPAGSTLYFENDVPTPAFCPPEAQPIGWGNYLEGVSDYV